MTVPSTYSPSLYTANGLTATFAYAFKIADEADLVVVVDGEELVLTTDYTVTGAGEEAGGDVTLLDGNPANGVAVALYRDTVIDRQNDYQNTGDLLSETLNADCDKPILILQELNENLERSLKTPIGSTVYDAEDQRIGDLADGENAQDAVTVAQLAAATGDGGAAFVGQHPHSVARTVLARLRDTVHLTDYGALGDGEAANAVLNRAAMADALIDSALAGGLTILIPEGVFDIGDAADSQWNVPSNTTIRGVGPRSILRFLDSSAVSSSGQTNRLFNLSDTDHVTLADFAIVSTAEDEDTSTNGKQFFGGDNINDLVISHVEMRYARLQAISLSECDRVLIQSCTLDHIARGGIILRDARNVRVVDSTLRNVGDDSIGLHSDDDEALGVHLPVNQVIADNTLEGCQGIRVLGARNCAIDNNTMRRCLRHGVHVEMAWATPPRGSGGTAVEGSTPQFNIAITNNKILDLLNVNPSASGTHAIRVWAYRHEDDGLIPVQPGVNAPIFDYTDLNNIDAGTEVSIGMFGVIVAKNIIGRSLPEVANYSDWGYGELWDRVPATLFTDPAITETEFDVTGISFTGPIDALLVDGNVITGLNPDQAAIAFLKDGAGTYQTFNNARVVNNIVRDCPGAGVKLDFTGTVDLVIEGNHFDLDPFFRHADHNADNTWASISAVQGISASGAWPGLSVVANTFKHMGRVSDATTGSYWRERNRIWCEPVAEGNNAGNFGIRVVTINYDDQFVIYDADPTSATFGVATTQPAPTANAKPTTGYYVRGAFVRNGNPTIVTAGGAGTHHVVQGWKRMTTSSAHVLNTDWVEVRTLTGG